MRIFLVIFLSIFIVGCATNKPLTSLPESVADYSLSRNNLTNSFPEIASYEERWRGFSPNFPTEKNLVDRLGEPKKIKRAWWEAIFMVGYLAAISADPIVWAIAFALRPYPTKTYFFEKGSYCVEAKIDKSISTGYESRMISWAWNENKEKCGN